MAWWKDKHEHSSTPQLNGMMQNVLSLVEASYPLTRMFAAFKLNAIV